MVPDGDLSYVVDVDPQIDVQGRDVDDVLMRYADLLGDYLDRYPYQCRGFDKFVPGGE